MLCSSPVLVPSMFSDFSFLSFFSYIKPKTLALRNAQPLTYISAPGCPPLPVKFLFVSPPHPPPPPLSSSSVPYSRRSLRAQARPCSLSTYSPSGSWCRLYHHVTRPPPTTSSSQHALLLPTASCLLSPSPNVPWGPCTGLWACLGDSSG